jgi:hypothetical protein
LPRCTPALRVIGKQSYEQRLRRLLPLSQISRESEIVGCFAYSLGGAVLHERRGTMHPAREAQCVVVTCQRDGARWDKTRRWTCTRAGRNNASCTLWPSAIARMHAVSRAWIEVQYGTCTAVPQSSDRHVQKNQSDHSTNQPTYVVSNMQSIPRSSNNQFHPRAI